MLAAKDPQKTSSSSALARLPFFDAEFSPLQQVRLKAAPDVPKLLEGPVIAEEVVDSDANGSSFNGLPPEAEKETLAALFPHTWGRKPVRLVPATSSHHEELQKPDASQKPALRVGIVLSGGQAPGGHNVIAGAYDYLKKRNPASQLFGFRMGPSGVVKGDYVLITDALMNRYRNQGGFDMLYSGRTKIETETQCAASLENVRKLDLHGLIVVGGDDSNTNAALLAEYFAVSSIQSMLLYNRALFTSLTLPIANTTVEPTSLEFPRSARDLVIERELLSKPPERVLADFGLIGFQTIDGDLRNAFVEASFGFDTAVKTYAEFIGNLATDIATSRKYYHFVRLMGRSASHVTLHCALLTRPNMVLIGEEIQRDRRGLLEIVQDIVETVIRRQDAGKDFGLILVPEGLLEFVPEVGELIREINNIVASGAFSVSKLTPQSSAVFNALPDVIRAQLLLDRDPHGNIQISRIATEQLLTLLVQRELVARGRSDRFTPRSHFFGYEGRAGMPSIFDSNYCYALGLTSAALIENNKSGYMAVVRDLASPVAKWRPGGCPLTTMMNIERRHGKDVPVIRKYYVELDKEPFTLLTQVRDVWKLRDVYASPGPIQFDGPCALLTNYSIQPPKLRDILPDLPFGYEVLKERWFFGKGHSQLSPLQKERLAAPVTLPALLREEKAVLVAGRRVTFPDIQVEAAIGRCYPQQCRKHRNLTYKLSASPLASVAALKAPVSSSSSASDVTSRLMGREDRGLRVGILLNGQQAPGVANVLVGLWEWLCSQFPRGKLFGFIQGVAGLTAVPPNYIEVTRDDLVLSKNQGGFELLGRTNEAEAFIASSEGLEATLRTCKDLELDGLVLIGGRYTLTSAAFLAEEFIRKSIPTSVIAVPATQNNNICASILESALGFDTASKCYSTLIGNLCTDGASNAKYWLFIRLMGADKSQIAVDTALATHPHMVLVSEANAAGDKTLQDVVNDIADVVVSRSQKGLFFGNVIIPEGLIASLPEFRQLINELKVLFSALSVESAQALAQSLVTANPDNSDFCRLAPWNRALLGSLPEYFRQQLIQAQGVGGLEFTKIATEELLAEMVAHEVHSREKSGSTPKVHFTPLCFYFGYQSRSALPSQFDCSLGLAHGTLAGIAIHKGLTGYVTALRGLAAPTEQWMPVCYPITAFLRLPSIGDQGLFHPAKIPVVSSDMVALQSKAFQTILKYQHRWESGERCSNPGPIQYLGPTARVFTPTLIVEHRHYLDMLEKAKEYIDYIRELCCSGASELALQLSVSVLSVLYQIQDAGHTDTP